MVVQMASTDQLKDYNMPIVVNKKIYTFFLSIVLT